MENQKFIEEDEVDIKEVFKTIWNKKIFIIVSTFIITIAAVVYSSFKTPIYEAKALVEIGSYKLNNDKKVIIDDASELAKKLNILFIDLNKNTKNARIVSIIAPKKQNTFIEITSNAISNKLAKNEIKIILDHIINEHQSVLEDVKSDRELQLKNIDRKIHNIKDNEIKLLEEEIAIQENMIIEYKKQVDDIKSNLKKIEDLNPTLAALKLMEKRDIGNHILAFTKELIGMKNRKDELITTTLAKLEEDKNSLETFLLPHNYSNTHIVGEIITNKNPIKPKKKLIAVASFIVGFILSIIIVFLIRFFQNLKK